MAEQVLKEEMPDTEEWSTESSYPETADIATSNDNYATRFRGATGAWMLELQERGMLKLLKKVVPAGDGVKVLDVGGGHGQLAFPLVREGYKVTVLGSSKSCRWRIRELVKEGGSCSFEVGDVLHLPYPDKYFDAVVSVRMLTHCSAWPELVKELCRVSKGPVITDYPTSQSLNAIAPALFSAKKKFEKNTRTWTLFRHKQVRDAFAAAGFRETGRFCQFFLPMVVHRALKCRALSAFLEGCCRAVGLTRLWGTPVIVCQERTPDAKG